MTFNLLALIGAFLVSSLLAFVSSASNTRSGKFVFVLTLICSVVTFIFATIEYFVN